MWKNLKAKTKRPSQADLDLGPGDEDGGGGSPRSPFGRGAMSTRKGTPLAGVLPADSDAWSVVTQAVGRLPLCGELSAAELEDLARGLELVEHRADEVILEAGAGSDDGLYIVWEGNAVAEKAGEVVVEYRSGDHFGELGLLGGKNGGRRNATVRATGGHSQAKHVTHCLRLTVEKFRLVSTVAAALAEMERASVTAAAASELERRDEQPAALLGSPAPTAAAADGEGGEEEDFEREYHSTLAAESDPSAADDDPSASPVAAADSNFLQAVCGEEKQLMEQRETAAAAGATPVTTGRQAAGVPEQTAKLGGQQVKPLDLVAPDAAQDTGAPDTPTPPASPATSESEDEVNSADSAPAAAPAQPPTADQRIRDMVPKLGWRNEKVVSELAAAGGDKDGLAARMQEELQERFVTRDSNSRHHPGCFV